MSEDRMFALTIRPLADGGLELEQGDGFNDPAIVTLHPSQMRFIAERSGVFMTERHIARVRELADWIFELDQLYRSEIVKRCGVEPAIYLRTITSMLTEVLDDLDEATPTDRKEKPAPAHGAKRQKVREDDAPQPSLLEPAAAA